MANHTTIVPLGTQLATFNAFCKATSPVHNYATVVETWNAMRRLVLPQNEVPIDAFGGLPANDEKVEFFSRNVRGTLYHVLGRRVEEIAHGEVSKALCEYHRVTPEEMMRYGAMGLLPLNAVQAFNASAAKYMSYQLDRKRIRLGFVVKDAVEFLERELIRERDLPDFIDVIGFNADDFREIGFEIEKMLRLLVHYGPEQTSSLFQRHRLDANIMYFAVEHGLISEQSAMELCNAYASSIHKTKRYQREMHRLGIVGLIPSSYVLGAILMSRGLDLYSMLGIFVQNPIVTIPLSLCLIIFSLMTWRPNLFIRD